MCAPRYLPYLTDEDLAEDPPDHKSGYVAVIGKPNAGMVLEALHTGPALCGAVLLRSGRDPEAQPPAHGE